MSCGNLRFGAACRSPLYLYKDGRRSSHNFGAISGRAAAPTWTVWPGSPTRILGRMLAGACLPPSPNYPPTWVGTCSATERLDFTARTTSIHPYADGSHGEQANRNSSTAHMGKRGQCNWFASCSHCLHNRSTGPREGLRRSLAA